ncbi:hypothetical protein HQQ94_18365 [Shewanella sp. VB17]|uniref:hypothetical protein n=1 Tax=Shewanella sp. VB17 TaxID=2739432 RepID=UPI0015644BE1|nr:hypothetical protein [Shewanella sp. VB17]NRD75147.1 hypothetical protein [Shewanella sp. VB17]
MTSKIFGDLVQKNLGIVYQDNSAYLQDYDNPGTYLSDGKVGRITEKWLAYFCHEFNQAHIAKSNSEFVAQLLSSLMTIAELSQNYPQWRQILKSLIFSEWMQQQAVNQLTKQDCIDKPQCYISAQTLHLAIDEFVLSQQNTSKLIPSTDSPLVANKSIYYQLSNTDMKKLAVWSDTRFKLNELMDQPFASEAAIVKELRPLTLALVGELSPSKINALLNQLVVVTPASYQSVAAPTISNSAAITQAATSLLPTDTPSDLTTVQKDPADPSGASSAIINEASVTKAAPVSVLMQPQSYAITKHSIKDFTQAVNTLNGEVMIALTQAQMKQLAMLEAMVFNSRYLLSVALKDIDLTTLSDDVFKSLVELFKKLIRPTDIKVNELVWQATPGCGCAENISLEGNHSPIYYGFYQYWQPDEQTIDYSRLTRMAYFSASIDGSRVTVPDNLRVTKPFSEFVNSAHNHRVKVDLVFSNNNGSPAEQQVEIEFNDALLNDIIATVQAPLEGYPINNLKPIMSLGQSPKRSMADGVTLNLDLQQINTQAKVNEVNAFIKKLKMQLNANNVGADTAGIEDQYYLNMIVPSYALVSEASLFYTLDNLAELEPYINLYIMKFSPFSLAQENTQEGLSNDMNISESMNVDVERLKLLRTYMGDKKHTDIAGVLFNKSIPLLQIDGHNTDYIKQVLNYTKWSYLGAAYWTYPLSDGVSDLIDISYFSGQDSTFTLIKPAVNLANKVCDTLCPLRWPLRVVFLLLFLSLAIYMLTSLWVFRLRSLYKRWYFFAFLLGYVIFIMLVFSCDPYWKEQQSLFLFLFLFIALVVNFFRQKEIEKRKNLP